MNCIYAWAKDSTLEDSFSSERFERYMEWAGGEKEQAFYLYAMNTALSESFYTPLHILEITLRNRLNILLNQRFGEAWYDHEAISDGNLKVRLQKARADLTAEKYEQTAGRIISVLTFGFWTGLLSPHYEELWRSTLHRIARKADGSYFARKEFTRYLTPIRVLRNRIAHHEPILSWDLRKHYENIIALTTWLSPDAATWSQHHSRFLDVFPPDGVILKR